MPCDLSRSPLSRSSHASSEESMLVPCTEHLPRLTVGKYMQYPLPVQTVQEMYFVLLFVSFCMIRVFLMKTFPMVRF